MKIYDCFTYCGEDLLLELRLETLWEKIDKFVIIEGNKFFNGKKRSKLFSEEKFKKYLSKINYYFVEDFPEHNGNNWEYEYFLRNQIKRGLSNCESSDMIIISDVDEIPNINIDETKNFDSYIFLQEMFYYKFNLKIVKGLKWDDKWPGPKSIKYKYFETAQKTREMRVKNIPKWRIDQKINRKVIINGGWHFSYIMSSDEIKNKIQSFSHTEFLNFADSGHISEMIKQKKDLFERKNTEIKAVEIDSTFPKALYNNMKKYQEWIEVI